MAERIEATEAGIAGAVELLRSGSLVALPTDTVYGIGCRVGDPDALARIFEAKRRPPEKRIPILVADLAQAGALGFRVDRRAEALAGAFWPGALTVILAAVDGSGSTQAFRAPNHRVALDLIRHSGPLAVTSANRSGEPETYDADDVLVAFADTSLLVAVVDGGRVPGGVASTIVDLAADPPRVLREGPITREQLTELVGLVD